MAEKYTAIYVRVSSEGQSTKSQKPDLELWSKSQEGPTRWFEDKFTGRSMDRPGWAKIEKDIEGGKIKGVAVWRIDRLGRTASGLTALFDLLRNREVNLVSLKDGVDLSTPAGRMMAQVLASVAEYETELRSERQRAGIRIALEDVKAGKRKGWGGSEPGIRKKVTPVQEKMIRQMKADGEPITAIAGAVGLSRPTIYDVLATPI